MEMPDRTSRRTKSTLEYGRQEKAVHKREFSMPDYMAVDYPDNKFLRESMKTRTDSQESLTLIGDARETAYSPLPDQALTSVLSGHRGWVTVDRASLDRAKAAESYQSTNPT